MAEKSLEKVASIVKKSLEKVVSLSKKSFEKVAGIVKKSLEKVAQGRLKRIFFYIRKIALLKKSYV